MLLGFRYCSFYLCTNFAHPFLLCIFLLASFHVFHSFKMSEFSHVFFDILFLFPIILTYHIFFILIKCPNHLCCCLCIFFNIGLTFSSRLTTSFLTLSLPVISFFRKFFISIAWILLLTSFVITQLP